MSTVETEVTLIPKKIQTMATQAEEAAVESAAEIVQSEHEQPDKEQEEVGEADAEQEEEIDEADEGQEEEIEDEEGVEMFMTDNWDVVDEASGSEHDDDGGEIDHDIEIDDSEMPTGPEYEADGDLEDDMEASFDDEHIDEEGNIQEEMGELDDENDQKEVSSSAKQTDESNESKKSDDKSKDALDKDETKTSEENAGQKEEGDKEVNTDGDGAEKVAAEATGDDVEKSEKKESGDSEKNETEEKNSVDKAEGEDKTKKVEKKSEGDKKDSAKSKGDKKDAGKSANSRAEAKARAEAEAKARAEARAKADARRKADHEAMTKEWDNLVVTLSEVEVRNFKADDFFLCLCKAKEIHIDFEDQNGLRTLGKMKVAFNASSPVRYEGLIKSLANLRMLGIKIDECSEHLLKKTNDFCRRLGLQEGHPRDRSLFLKNLPEDTTDLSLKEYIPNMVRACVARKPGGKVVGWSVVEMPTKSECLAFLHENKFIKIGKHQVRVSRMTSIGKPEIPTTPRVQQWLWGKLFYLSDKRREYWNNKKNSQQDSRPTLDRRVVGRFSRGNFRDNKFLNTRGRRPNMRGTGLRSGMNLGMRTNMGIPGLNVALGAGNMGGMGMGQSNMGNMMGQGMGGNMGGLNMGSGMGMGNMGMASGMGGMGTGMMGNMGGAGVGMGMGGNSMGGLNMNQGMGQMGSDMRQMRSNISSISRSRSRDRIDRSPSQNRGFGSERSFSDQRQRRSTGGTIDTGRFSNRRGSSRDGGMRRTSDINVRPSRGNRGNFTRGGSNTGGRGGGNYRGGRDSRSNFDSSRGGGFDRNRSPVRSRRDSGDLSRDYRDYDRGGHFSDHSDYEDDYNRGGSNRSREDDYDREYDRPSRSSDRMGQSSAPRRQQQMTRRRERSPVWDDRDYDSHDMGLDDDSSGRGVKKTASRRDLSEKLGVVLSNERQGVQDDRAMVALLQTALDAMQKKEGSKSPGRGSVSSSMGHPVAVPSTRRPNPVLKRRKSYDEDHSQMQKRPREEFSSQGQSSSMGRTSTMGSGSYSGGQTSQQYRSPLQNQYSASKPSFGAARGGVNRSGRGSMRGGNMRGGAARGTSRGGPSRGGASRGSYNQGGNRPQMGMGGSQGVSRNYEDY